MTAVTGTRKNRPTSLATANLARYGFTLGDLAERAQVSVAAASLWLRGERNGPAGDRLRLVLVEQLPATAAAEVLAAIPQHERRAA